MNKIYNIVWSTSSNQWVVASEVAKNHSGTHSSIAVVEGSAVAPKQGLLSSKLSRMALVLAAALGWSFMATNVMAAECAGAINSYVAGTDNTSCTVSGNATYTYVQSSGTTIVNVTAPNFYVFNSSSGSAAVYAINGGVINFAGNLGAQGFFGNRMGVLVGYPNAIHSEVNVAGNLEAIGAGGTGEALYIWNDSLATVGGNFTATTNGGTRSAVRNWGTLIVQGSTLVTSDSADGMVVGGIGKFGGAVTVNINSAAGKTGVNLLGNNTFGSDLTVTTTAANSIGILGSINSDGVAHVATIAGNLNVSTLGAGSTGIDQSGSLTVQGDSTVTTKGDNAAGVATTNGGTSTFNKLTVNTSGASSVGVSVAGVGSTTTLGSGSTVTTTGASAHGVQVVDAVINFASGEVKTSGDNADGIFVNNTISGMQLTTGANVTTTGANAHGVVLVGTSATLNGNITTTGTGASGVVMQGGGTSTELTTSAGKTISAIANAIEASSKSAVTINNAATLTSATANGINVVNAVGGSTIINSGDITATTAGKFVIAGGEAIETVTTTAGTLTGNTDLGAGNDSFTASGGALVGNTLMGSGDDVTTLTGSVDVTKAPQFDGGTGTDVLNVDGVFIRGFTAASNDGTGNVSTGNNSNLTGWETINVKNAGTLKLSNNLFTANNTGTLNIDATSTLDLKGNSPGIFTIFGNVNNSGVMTMQDGAADDVTTITGNYTGIAGSSFKIDTVLGNDASATDMLVVNGSTAGSTGLTVTNVGGAGAQTVIGIKVVDVIGASNGTFALTAPVQAGAFEYSLLKNGNGGDAGDWYLTTMLVPTCANTPSMCPVTPGTGTPIPIYRPGVALYTTAQTANMDAGFTLLSSLHQRVGEQRDFATDNAQSWGRIIANNMTNKGDDRFGYDQTTTGFQFGNDLLHTTNNLGTQQRAGLTLQYLHSDVDARDRIRPLVGLDADTGSMRTNSYGLGAYYTRMTQAGAYLDVVGQVNRLNNHFSDSYGGKSTQNAWQGGLSVEVGKPMLDLNGWKFEPQAQLSYLHTNYDSFSDKYSSIEGINANSLRGRLGLRVYKDAVNIDVNAKPAQFYGIVNIIHDFIDPETINLQDLSSSGTASVSESFDRTYGEFGMGVQGYIKKNVYVYADGRLQHSFEGNKDGVSGNIGVKFEF